jgi:signal transduction histidine kinase
LRVNLQLSIAVIRLQWFFITEDYQLHIGDHGLMENTTNTVSGQASSLGSFKKEYSEFIHLATHDLDAPLRKLSTLVGMLTKKLKPGFDDGDALGYIDRIESCVADMRSLIDSMSTLSQVTSDPEPIKLCDLQKIGQEVIDGLQGTIRQKNAIVQISDLPSIEGMPLQLRLLLKNLLENSLKFSRPDVAPEIQLISSQLTDEEKKQKGLAENIYYKIEIIDNGIGFKAENSEKIFKPFVRLHGKSQYAGTGIGLAIARKIADNHQGLLFAESKENYGSRFVLILPQTPAEIC